MAFGPIMAESKDQESHRRDRDLTAAYEAELARRIGAQGWSVINKVHSRKVLDEGGFQAVWQGFIEYFPKTSGNAAITGDAS